MHKGIIRDYIQSWEPSKIYILLAQSSNQDHLATKIQRIRAPWYLGARSDQLYDLLHSLEMRNLWFPEVRRHCVRLSSELTKLV